ncbi:hypothetical protein DES41_111143 [Pseudorhodoferax soli]|uniref:Uncharacterized protein n=1 Tax=Pseudorhodoferax soli TaxID=545864 RepID=A0A368XE98_9BURK|nr:hypothetical protein DES41_111143 [Pseudorhodoferax soli]
MPKQASSAVALATIRGESSPADPKLTISMESELVLQHLNARGFVPFHPTLAQHLGHKAALFLGLCLYWSRHAAKNNPQRQGWFYLSSHEIAQATSLSRREQDTVRDALGTAGLLEQQLVGRPARMHYRLNLRHLANRLEVIDAGTATVETAWAWFQKSVSFYRPLGDLAGSAAGGLFLSFVLRRQRKALLAGHSADVMRVEPAEVERVLCLSPKVQRSVRQRLMQLGILTLPTNAASMVHLNIQAILACVRGQGVAKLRSVPEKTAKGIEPQQRSLGLIVQPSLLIECEPGARPQAGQFNGLALLRTAMFDTYRRGHEVADFQQLHYPSAAASQGAVTVGATVVSPLSDPAQSAMLAAAPGAQTAKLVPVQSAQSAKLRVPKPPSYIQTGSTNTTTTNLRSQDAARATQEGCRRRSVEPVQQAPCADQLDGLIFPGRLPVGVIDGLRSALSQAPVELRQRLLDELQGQLRIPTKTIHNPVAWMLGLIRACAAGAFLSFADQVAKERQDRCVSAQVEPGPTTPLVRSPEVREEARRKLQALRLEFKQKVGR